MKPVFLLVTLLMFQAIVKSEDFYYVDDGCISETNSEDDIKGHYQAAGNTAYTRCCNNAGNSCETINNCNEDQYLRTYAEAEAKCENEGKRLCTKLELLSEICCGTGGGCDSEAIWTSTPYEPSYYVDDGCSSDNNTPNDVMGFYQEESYTAHVRCCSSNGNSCDTPFDCTDSSNMMTYAEAESECSSSGMRLCTKDELLSNVCCGAGGQCDHAYVWTSTAAI